MKKDYFVFTSGKLMRKDNTLYFQNESGEKRSIPIETVDSLHLFGEVEINSRLLNFLAKNEVIVHVYNYYGYYSGTFVPRKVNVSGYLTVKQVSHYLDNEKRIYLAKNFVIGATHHILRNLRTYKIEESIKQIENLYTYLQETDFSSVNEIMSIEAAIRKEYYKTFSIITKDKFSFEK